MRIFAELSETYLDNKGKVLMRTTRILAALAVSVVLTATLGASGATVTASLVGDDNGDGIVMEDESGWNCTTMGNRQCGVVFPLPVHEAYIHPVLDTED